MHIPILLIFLFILAKELKKLKLTFPYDVSIIFSSAIYHSFLLSPDNLCKNFGPRLGQTKKSGLIWILTVRH